jgi:hypothetical protein
VNVSGSLLNDSPLDACDTANEKVGSDTADVGDEEAAVGDRVNIRDNIVAEMLVPVAPLPTAMEYVS